MINVNQITSRLASMPDQALQQYAAMHKNDPYTMALALSESNRRKQMRQGAQMQAPQQPKVVDQEIAGMAQAMPEDMGIGLLPAPNMQRMAEGGIVAFEGGGEVPGYAGGVFTGKPEDYIYSGGIGQPFYIDAPYNPRSPSPLSALKGRKFSSKQEALDAINALAAPTSLPAGTAFTPPAMPGAMTGAAVPASSAPVQGAPLPDQLLPPAPPKPPAAPKAPAPSAQGLASLTTDPAKLREEYEALQGRAPTTTPYDAQIKEITEGAVKAKKEGLEQLESDIKAAGVAFQDREARLGKRKEKLDIQEDKLPYMALMEAGLAIMSGTSPNALTNIGAGGAVGMKSYAAGLDKLTDARDKLDDAYGKIEEFRRNESMMNAKERRAAKAEITSAELDGKKVALAALQDNWKMKREDANKVWSALESNRKTAFEQQQENARTAQREAGASARAKASLPQTLYETLGAAKPDSALMKGYNMAKKQEEMARMYDLYTKQASDTLKGPEFTSKYPTFQAYVQEFQSAIGPNTGGGFLNQVPANVPVLPPKK